MVDEQLTAQVRALREQGYPPKAIARTLGGRPAEVARIVRAVAQELAAAAPAPALRCWVSHGWSAGLGVPASLRHGDRPNRMGDVVGIAAVLLAQAEDRRRDRYRVSGFLVDTYCLGVKDAHGPRTASASDVDRLLGTFFTMFDGPPSAVPVDVVRHLVWGAVEYARRLGFEPHRDFARAAGSLGQLNGPSAVTFGRHGKPSYTQGPYDDPAHVLRTLRRTVGDGQFEFSVAADPEALRALA